MCELRTGSNIIDVAEELEAHRYINRIQMRCDNSRYAFGCNIHKMDVEIAIRRNRYVIACRRCYWRHIVAGKERQDRKIVRKNLLRIKEIWEPIHIACG